MINKAKKVKNLYKNGHEFKLLIEASLTEPGKFDIHFDLDGVISKTLSEVRHYHIISPFGDDSE
jgi:hypothetical protein